MFKKPASLEEALQHPLNWSPIKGFSDVQVYRCGSYIAAVESTVVEVCATPRFVHGVDEMGDFIGWDTESQQLVLRVTRDDGTIATIRAHRGVVEDGEVEATSLDLAEAIGTPDQDSALAAWLEARRRAARRALQGA